MNFVFLLFALFMSALSALVSSQFVTYGAFTNTIIQGELIRTTHFHVCKSKFRIIQSENQNVFTLDSLVPH